MEFELISLANPVVEPAKEEKQYPLGWLENFSASVQSQSAGSAFYEVRAMALDGTKHPSQTNRVYIENIWAAANDVPEVGAAIMALVAAVKAYDEWLAKQPQPEQ